MDIEDQNDEFYNDKARQTRNQAKNKRKQQSTQSEIITKKIKSSATKDKNNKIQEEQDHDQFPDNDDDEMIDEVKPANHNKKQKRKVKKIIKKEKEQTKQNKKTTKSSTTKQVSSRSVSSDSLTSQSSTSINTETKKAKKAKKVKQNKKGKRFWQKKNQIEDFNDDEQEESKHEDQNDDDDNIQQQEKKKNYNNSYKDGRVQRGKNQRMFLMRVERLSDNDWSFSVLGEMSNNPKLSTKTYDKLDAALIQRLRGRLDKKQKPQSNLDLEKIDFGDDADCAICFDGLTADECIKCMTCKKYFHNQCMTMWLQKNQSCPLCRGNWVQKQDEQDDEYIEGAVRDGALGYLTQQNIKVDNQINEVMEEDDGFD